jgi:23S rRNA (guanosine2251-2'-O)-methyltransferase
MRIEGRNAVREAIRAGMKVSKLELAKGMKPNKSIDEIVTALAPEGIKPKFVERADMDRKSETGAHQGIMIWAAPFEYTPLKQIVRKAEEIAASKNEAAGLKPEASLIIVLDHVTDPGNLGAIARSAEVIGAAGMVVAKDRAAGITPQAFKSAAGALIHLPVAQVTNISRALEDLKKEGYWVAGASEQTDTIMWDAPLTGKIALVMGAEGAGISRLVKEKCDFLVKLPQHGQVESLNVAQASTALMYEYLRQNQA